MDSRFYEAWFNTSHRVLGRNLHPFCLNDALILSLSESPFMLGTAGVRYSATDLQQAVSICSSPAEVFFEARFSRSWLQKASSALWALRMGRNAELFEAECQKFVDYIDDFYSPPEVWQNESDSPQDSLRAPWVLGNVVFLMRNSSLHPREIWTMPIGKALWIAATMSEQLGSSIQMVSEEEQEGMRALGLT